MNWIRRWWARRIASRLQRERMIRERIALFIGGSQSPQEREYREKVVALWNAGKRDEITDLLRAQHDDA